MEFIFNLIDMPGFTEALAAAVAGVIVVVLGRIKGDRDEKFASALAEKLKEKLK